MMSNFYTPLFVSSHWPSWELHASIAFLIPSIVLLLYLFSFDALVSMTWIVSTVANRPYYISCFLSYQGLMVPLSLICQLTLSFLTLCILEILLTFIKHLSLLSLFASCSYQQVSVFWRLRLLFIRVKYKRCCIFIFC